LVFKEASAASRLAGSDTGRVRTAGEPFADGDSEELLHGCIFGGCDFLQPGGCLAGHRESQAFSHRPWGLVRNCLMFRFLIAMFLSVSPEKDNPGSRHSGIPKP
jgi:hypothetical protein